MARFCALASGSSGNSFYIGNGRYGILVDAGISAAAVTRALMECGSTISDIQGIFITHEHSDHIKGLQVLCKKNKIPVFMSKGTFAGLIQQKSEIDRGLIRIMENGDSAVVADMEIRSFATPHDANESFGYRIHTADGRKIGIATDLGCVPQSVEESLCGCDFVLLESNHDENMLKNGGYPYYLKRRILGERGHLSNKACADLLSRLIEAGGTRFVLGHISRENNMPEIAYHTSLNCLCEKGFRLKVDFELETANQGTISGLYIF